MGCSKLQYCQVIKQHQIKAKNKARYESARKKGMADSEVSGLSHVLDRAGLDNANKKVGNQKLFQWSPVYYRVLPKRNSGNSDGQF